MMSNHRCSELREYQGMDWLTGRAGTVCIVLSAAISFCSQYNQQTVLIGFGGKSMHYLFLPSHACRSDLLAIMRITTCHQRVSYRNTRAKRNVIVVISSKMFLACFLGEVLLLLSALKTAKIL
jgi:hypothetical protein